MPNQLDTLPDSRAIVLHTQTLIDRWLLYESERGLSVASTATYRRGMNTYLAWVSSDGPGTPPEARDILTYKAFLAKSYSPSSINVKLSSVRSFYRWLVVTGQTATNPAREIQGARRADSHVHKRDTLTSSEVKAILGLCGDSPKGQRDRAILTLMLYCALRAIEIVRADIDNLKTQSGRMVLEVWGKGRLEPDEVVIIPQDQEHIIRGWVSERLKITAGDPAPLFISLSNQSLGQRISTRGIRYIVKRLYAEAGISGSRKTTHSLRHTAITKAIEKGAKPLQVQSMARHESFDTTQRYYHEIGRVTDPAEDYIDYD